MASRNLKNQNSLFMYVCMMFLVCSLAKAQTTTTIVDSNFEQALINLGIDSNGLNGNILDTDAESVNTLNVDQKSISDLSGIEAFVNLKHLYAYSNHLTALNLSQNTFLEVLDIENNGLETLNISQNTLLKEIYVSNNLLQTLTVTHLPDLELLSCSLNNLSTLNISNNAELGVLWCYSNNLNTLNVSNNHELESLFCGDNNLNVLNISSNYDLRTLSCSGNNLNNLSFSQCSDISYIDISNNNFSEIDLSANNGLKRLLCENNNLTELDLFNAPQLLLLHAGNNLLETIDISTNNDLRYVRLGSNNLSSLDIRNSENHRISSFNAENNANLSCIFVDNVQASYLVNWVIDSASHFVANEADCNSLSTLDFSNSLEIVLYPNPATDYLYIKNVESNTQIEIYSVNGQRVKQLTASPQEDGINVSSLRAGLYMVKVTHLNQSIIKKILIN